MRLDELFNLISPSQLITIVDYDDNVVQEPVSFNDMKAINVYHVLDDEVIGIEADDDVLHVMIAYDEEEEY